MRDFFRASIAKGRGEEGRSNPLFPTKKTPRWKRWLFTSAGLALPVGGGIFSVHTLSQPQFLITNIEIAGTACLDQSVVRQEVEAELAERTGLFFTRANKFLLKPKALSARLTTNLPLNSAEVTVDGNTLRVTVQEDVVMVLFHSGENWFLADLTGAILRTLSPEEINFLDTPSADSPLPFAKIPKILLAESVPSTLTEPIYSPARLSTLGELDKGLRTLGLTPSRYMLETRKDTWLSVSVIEKPYSMLFDLEKPVSEQIKVLGSLISQHQEVPGMSYVDLRFGIRVYMK